MTPVGTKVQVEITEIDSRGKISLSPVVAEDAASRLRSSHTLAASLQLVGTKDCPPPGFGPGRGHRPPDRAARRRAGRHRAGPRRPVGLLRALGRRRLDATRPQPAGRRFSHYLEHLLFKGTPRSVTPSTISAAFDRGRRRAQRVHGQGLHLLLRAGAGHRPAARGRRDHRHGRSPRCSARSDVEAERGVILEEIAMHGDEPADEVHDVFASAAVRRRPAGPADPRVRGEHHRHLPRHHRLLLEAQGYAPQQTVVAISGNLDHATVAAAGEAGARRLRAVRGSPVLAAAEAAEAVPLPARSATSSGRTGQVNLVLGTPSLRGPTPGGWRSRCSTPRSAAA